MKSAGDRILVSIGGSGLTWILYDFLLGVAYRQFRSQFFDFGHARDLYLLVIPALLCVAWAIGPSLSRKFDGTTIAAVSLAIFLTVPICVIVSLLILGCDYFGDCL